MHVICKFDKNKSTWGIIVVKSNSFVDFLEETSVWKNHFDFVWPLEGEKIKKKSQYLNELKNDLLLLRYALVSTTKSFAWKGPGPVTAEKPHFDICKLE